MVTGYTINPRDFPAFALHWSCEMRHAKESSTGVLFAPVSGDARCITSVFCLARSFLLDVGEWAALIGRATWAFLAQPPTLLRVKLEVGA